MNKNDLGPLPKINPRVQIVEEASYALGQATGKLFNEYELTPSEQFLVLSRELQRLAGMCVSTERRFRDSPL